ncbi:MAG TPA: ABC transporter ATP-binding protein [Thermodesulfobacteriota bacterium]|nr:ABC transporter ATP-binding protein [Thermodesulfobacteriota bacterium]
MLLLQDVHTYYGESHILKGLSSEIKRGELVTLLGRNGAGKTTTLRSIMGIVLPKQGKITFDRINLCGQKPHSIASLGVGYVPEERMIFPSLTVLENLSLPSKGSKKGLWDFEKIYQYFPVLGERKDQKGSQLSGGEQQMLAIARILTMDLKLMLLDEPTEGLAPMLVREIGTILKEIRKTGITILLVEQNTRFAEGVSDRHCILYNGQIVYEGSNEAFKTDQEVQKRYLGV